MIVRIAVTVPCSVDEACSANATAEKASCQYSRPSIRLTVHLEVNLGSADDSKDKSRGMHEQRWYSDLGEPITVRECLITIATTKLRFNHSKKSSFRFQK